jgi:DNA replication protein DnaC
MNEELVTQLKFLRLPDLLEHWASIISDADKKQPSYTRFLKDVIAKEYAIKKERARCLRIKKARIPEVYAMETYPFDKQPKLNKKQVLEIYDSNSYLTKSQHIALIGPTGVGKTGLATSYLIHAINQGYTARFILFPDLVDELYQSLADHSSKRVMNRFLKYDLLQIDELGYCEIDTQAKAGQIFQLLRQRKRSTIITSNLGFAEWETFLKDKNLTAALIDKFTAHCHIINMLQCKSITPKTVPPPKT